MKNTKAIINTFSLGILISSLILSPFLLDFTLISRFISCALFLALALCFLYTSKTTLKLKCDFVLISYLAYVLFCGLSLLWAKNKAEAFFDASKTVLSFLIFLFSYFSFRQHYSFFADRLRKISVFLFYLTFIGACVQYSQVNTATHGWHYSITGLNGHKNLYASFLFLNLFFLIDASFHLTGKWRFLALLALVLTVCLIIALRTKAVWAGGVVALFTYSIIYIYKTRKPFLKLKNYTIITLCLVSLNVFFLFVLQPLIQSGINHANAQETNGLLDVERLQLWNKTYHMIHNHMMFGTGVGNWQVYFPDATLTGLWRAEDLNYTFQRPHNDFLWILSQTGLIGFNLFLVFLISFLVLLIKTLRFIEPRYFKTVTLSISFIIGYYTISFFDFPMERMEHLIWINVLLGLGYYHIQSGPPLKTIINLPISRPYSALVLFFVLGIIFFDALRYYGELNTRRMYDAKKASNAHEVIHAGSLAKNFAYTLDPTSVPIDWYIGNANAALGNYAQAQQDFIEAYALNPYNRNVVNDLASAYSVNNKQDAAKILYQEASRISPRFDDPKLNLAAIYIQEKNYQKASECLASIYHNSERRSQYQKIVDAKITK